MPKLHLAYLVEDVEYPIPEELQASKEVGSSFSLSFFMCYQYQTKIYRKKYSVSYLKTFRSCPTQAG